MYEDEIGLVMVNQNHDRKKEEERLKEEELRKIMKRNIKPYEEEYKPKKKKTRHYFYRSVIAILIVLGIAKGAQSLKVNNQEIDIPTTGVTDTQESLTGIEGLLSYNNNFALLKDNINYIVNDNTHRTQNNDGHFYSTFDMAQDILSYQGDYDLDTVIYGVYERINYEEIKNLNEIFSYMKMIISANPEEYSEEILATCNYGSFTDYLEAHGFEDIDEYKKVMKKNLTNYEINLEEKEGLGR